MPVARRHEPRKEEKCCTNCFKWQPLTSFNEVGAHCKRCCAWVARKRREANGEKRSVTVAEVLAWRVEMQSKIKEELGK